MDCPALYGSRCRSPLVCLRHASVATTHELLGFRFRFGTPRQCPCLWRRRSVDDFPPPRFHGIVVPPRQIGADPVIGPPQRTNHIPRSSSGRAETFSRPPTLCTAATHSRRSLIQSIKKARRFIDHLDVDPTSTTIVESRCEGAIAVESPSQPQALRICESITPIFARVLPSDGKSTFASGFSFGVWIRGESDAGDPSPNPTLSRRSGLPGRGHPR